MMAPQLTERDNFFWLLIALVFLLASDAVFSQFESAQGKLLVNISLVLTLFVAVWALERNRRGRAWRNWKLGITFIIACLMVGDSLVESPILALGQFIYYSMVTLTTPEQPVARFLAYMEGITSIFYTTILVASLIGVRLAGNPGPGIAGQEPGS